MYTRTYFAKRVLWKTCSSRGLQQPRQAAWQRQGLTQGAQYCVACSKQQQFRVVMTSCCKMVNLPQPVEPSTAKRDGVSSCTCLQHNCCCCLLHACLGTSQLSGHTKPLLLLPGDPWRAAVNHQCSIDWHFTPAMADSATAVAAAAR
jgi:hypothetical protein